MGEDKYEPGHLSPPNSNETGGKVSSRQHMKHTQNTVVPTQVLWADGHPKTGEAMEADVETADDKRTDGSERPQPSHPMEDPSARRDTEETMEPTEEGDMCKLVHPCYKNTAPEVEIQREVVGNRPNRTKMKLAKSS